MAQGKYLFTSEAVSMGHPDKLADQISDGILDALFAQDPYSRVACETLVTTGIAVVAGEITTKAIVNYADVVRHVIREVGYTDDHMGICADTCAVMVAIDRQSPDIAMGVEREPDRRQGDRRRRPGADVRLRLQRHAGADALADRPGPSHSQPPDGRPLQEGSALAASRQQEPGDGRVRRPAAGPHRHRGGLDPAQPRTSARRRFAATSSTRSSSRCCPKSCSTARSPITSIRRGGSWSAGRWAIAD